MNTGTHAIFGDWGCKIALRLGHLRSIAFGNLVLSHDIVSFLFTFGKLPHTAGQLLETLVNVAQRLRFINNSII